MQTTTLPIQVTGAAPANAPQRQNQGSDAGEFGATLAREMAQRSAQPAAPQQAPKTQQPQQAQQTQAAKPQQQDDASPDEAQASAQDPAKAAGAVQDDSTEKTADASTDTTQQASDAQAAAAASPAADMLALMASFSQLHKAAAAPVAKDVKDSLKTTAATADAAQNTLQATLRRLTALDDAPGAKAKAGIDVPVEAQQQATGVAAGAVRQDAAGDGIDLRAALGAEPRGKSEPVAEFGAKAREIAAKLESIAPTAAPLPVQAQLQAAAVEAAKPALAAGEHLSARVGTAAWDNQVGQKIVWMVGSEAQTASLTLNPPDLGPMQVVLSVTGDQASVAFSASHEEVRHALESAMPRLREMMSESGIELGSATVSTGMPDQRQAQDGQAGGSGTRGGGSFADGPAVADAATPAATRTTVLGDGLVNTFA